jgi:hypothetical protein
MNMYRSPVKASPCKEIIWLLVSDVETIIITVIYLAGQMGFLVVSY